MLSKYNVKWDSQSKNSGENMPCGGNDTGLAVWVENGSIRFYIDKSGSFDENNCMLKLGRVRIEFNTNPFEKDFSQELDLRTGRIFVTGKDIKVCIWCEVDTSCVHVDSVSTNKVNMKVFYETWRFEDRIIPTHQHSMCYSVRGLDEDIITRKDTVNFHDNGVLFYHQNDNSNVSFHKTVHAQNLDNRKKDMFNPQDDLIFGGYVYGDNLICDEQTKGVYADIPYLSYCLKNEEPSTKNSFVVGLHNEYNKDINSYINACVKNAKKSLADSDDRSKKALDYWENYWSKSSIDILPNCVDESIEEYQMGRNYNLFRYMLGCNANGSYPTKFNGGLFTSDSCYSVPSHKFKEPATPDFRMWNGGSFTAQNQRLVYWCMLKSGDFDMMYSQFDFYNRALVNAKIRTQEYWGHDGCSFCEQLENSGLTIGMEWGWKNTPYKSNSYYNRTLFHDSTEQTSPWLRYYYTSQLEFSYMILKFNEYTGNDISEYIDFIENSVVFYDNHYRMRHWADTGSELDKDGKLVIFPSTALETYKNATNPTDSVSALHAVVDKLLKLEDNYINDDKKEYYKELKKRLPDISYRYIYGCKTIAPAKSYSFVMNVELPQLYPVFPYEQYNLLSKDLQTAINTFYEPEEKNGQKNYISWHQDNIFAARLGLLDEALEITKKKLKNSDRRFPAYWGPGHDWVPDHNWGGSGMIGLQDMLMQCIDDKILILPCWKKDIDVHFKLHAPKNTTVEVWYINGEISKLEVLPKEREKDIITSNK